MSKEDSFILVGGLVVIITCIAIIASVSDKEAKEKYHDKECLELYRAANSTETLIFVQEHCSKGEAKK